MRDHRRTLLLTLAFFLPLMLGLCVVFSAAYMLEEAVFNLGLEYRQYPFGLNLAVILIAVAVAVAALLAWLLARFLARKIRSDAL